MDLKERAYSVLVVSAAGKLKSALASALSRPRYGPVRFAGSVNEARRALDEKGYDHIVVNAGPSPQDEARFAVDAASSPVPAVLLIVRAELYADITERVIPHGVFVLSKPLSEPLLALALDWMDSGRERMRKLEKRALSVEEKMEEIRIVNRAKWILIERLSMDEAQAHRAIEKSAMDRCITRREAAQRIVDEYARPDEKGG